MLTDTVVAELVAQKPRVEPMPMSEVEQGHSIATLNRRGARWTLHGPRRGARNERMRVPHPKKGGEAANV